MKRFASAAGLLLLRVVVERLSPRRLGYRFSQAGSDEYTASAILDRQRR